jgi:hypothetical protein
MKETTMSESLERPSGRHPVNVGHLVMGLAFLGLVGVWALVQGDVVGGRDVRWLLPVPWVLAGIAGLLATTLSSRDRWGVHQTGWVAPDQPATDWGSHHTGWVGSGTQEPAAPDTELTDASGPTDPTEPGPTAPGG